MASTTVTMVAYFLEKEEYRREHGLLDYRIPVESEPRGCTRPFGHPRCLYIITLTFIHEIIYIALFSSYLRGMVSYINPNSMV